MSGEQQQTRSPWLRSTSMREPPALSEDLRAEVCVIGAGIAGMATAWQLVKAGRSVVVLDDGAPGSGETGRTTAHLSSALDDRYHVLERLHGEAGARLAHESHAAAIDWIETTVRALEVSCDFRRVDGYLFVPPGESTDVLDAELAAARRAGADGVELVERAPVRSFHTGPALRFRRQGQFHPLAFLQGLVAEVGRQGGRLFRGHVTGVKDGPPAVATTAQGRTVTADFLVCATNTPIIDRVAMHTKQAAYRTFAIAARVAPDSVPVALYWDTGDPYHYVRLHGDLLIIGGEDHKTGQEDDAAERFARLEAWARERFTMGEVSDRWSGQVMEPVDGMAFIGRNPGTHPHILIATGDSGHGMTHGVIAGMLLADIVQGRANPWESLYDPSRKTLRTAGEFVRENVNAVKHFAEYLTPGEVGSEEEIGNGEGAILRHGLEKLALYRDETGTMHRRSAVCPHLGCLVHWNSLERSWDCPCHGSRFTPEGEVLNGPAVTGLERR